jgi:hypothetical protein
MHQMLCLWFLVNILHRHIDGMAPASTNDVSVQERP